MAIGDIKNFYDEIPQFTLEVGGGFTPAASSMPYTVTFAPINYDKTKLKVKEIRVETVVSQDYMFSANYNLGVTIKDSNGVTVGTITNHASWDYPHGADIKAAGQTTAINGNSAYSVVGVANYNCNPGVAPYTTARARVNLRIYYVLEVTAEGTVEDPGSGGGGTVTKPFDPNSIIVPIVVFAGIGLVGIYLLTNAGKEFRAERAALGGLTGGGDGGGSSGGGGDSVAGGFKSIGRELADMGKGLKSLLKGT